MKEAETRQGQVKQLNPLPVSKIQYFHRSEVQRN